MARRINLAADGDVDAQREIAKAYGRHQHPDRARRRREPIEYHTKVEGRLCRYRGPRADLLQLKEQVEQALSLDGKQAQVVERVLNEAQAAERRETSR